MSEKREREREKLIFFLRNRNNYNRHHSSKQNIIRTRKIFYFKNLLFI